MSQRCKIYSCDGSFTQHCQRYSCDGSLSQHCQRHMVVTDPCLSTVRGTVVTDPSPCLSTVRWTFVSTWLGRDRTLSQHCQRHSCDGSLSQHCQRNSCQHLTGQRWILRTDEIPDTPEGIYWPLSLNAFHTCLFAQYVTLQAVNESLRPKQLPNIYSWSLVIMYQNSPRKKISPQSHKNYHVFSGFIRSDGNRAICFGNVSLSLSVRFF